MSINNENKRYIFLIVTLISLIVLSLGFLAINKPITTKKRAETIRTISCTWTDPPVGFFAQVKLFDKNRLLIRGPLKITNTNIVDFDQIDNQTALDGAYCEVDLIREHDNYSCGIKESFTYCSIDPSPYPTTTPFQYPTLTSQPTDTVSMVTPELAKDVSTTSTPYPTTTPFQYPTLTSQPTDTVSTVTPELAKNVSTTSTPYPVTTGSTISESEIVSKETVDKSEENIISTTIAPLKTTPEAENTQSPTSALQPTAVKQTTAPEPMETAMPKPTNTLIPTKTPSPTSAPKLTPELPRAGIINPPIILSIIGIVIIILAFII